MRALFVYTPKDILLGAAFVVGLLLIAYGYVSVTLRKWMQKRADKRRHE